MEGGKEGRRGVNEGAMGGGNEGGKVRGMKGGKKGWREQASAHFLGKGGAMAPLCQIKVGPFRINQIFYTFLFLNFLASASESFAKTVLSGSKTIVPVL